MPVCAPLLRLSTQRLSCSSHKPHREVGLSCEMMTKIIHREVDDTGTNATLLYVSLNSDFYTLLLFPAVLQMTGDDPVASDLPVFWRTVLKSVGNTALNPCVLHLLCLQWAIWLSTCQLKTIQEFQVMPCF